MSGWSYPNTLESGAASPAALQSSSQWERLAWECSIPIGRALLANSPFPSLQLRCTKYWFAGLCLGLRDPWSLRVSCAMCKLYWVKERIKKIGALWGDRWCTYPGRTWGIETGTILYIRHHYDNFRRNILVFSFSETRFFMKKIKWWLP